MANLRLSSSRSAMLLSLIIRDEESFRKQITGPFDQQEDLFFQKLDEPTENEKQRMCAKSYMSDLFDQTYDYQMVKTTELWEYGECDRSLTPKLGNDFNHLEQVRCFILKKGFQEPLIFSCDLHTGCAYLTEGNHRLRVALREKIPFVPYRVIPQWLPPNGSF